MAAKKSPAHQSKASFVRELPAALSAAEVVEKAKAAGIKLDVGYVYNILRTSRDSEKMEKSGTKNGVRATATQGPTARGNVSAEALLKAIGAELGLASAIRILEAERARVRAVLRG